MLEVYEILKPSTSLFINIAAAILIISLFVSGVLTVKIYRKTVSHEYKEIVSFFWSMSLALAAFSFSFLIFTIAYFDSTQVASNKLSKDQYTLNVINQKVIKPANDNHQMRIDRKDFDALKIITETNESYIVEGDSKDNSLHKTLELKKSDYKFERK